jgi:hypothetical protein
MFATNYDSNQKKISLYITVKCDGKKSFRLAASDNGKPNSKYADRFFEVDGERTIYLSFPVSPKSIALIIANVQDPKDTSFTVTLEEKPLKTYNVWLDMDTLKFVQLATTFSQICGFAEASPTGRMFRAKNDEFRIRFFDVIRDKGGNPIPTPARIGHETGTIEVSKDKFDRYTIPMRMAILLHEYSHKYRNPNIGLPIEDEVGADMNALYIYLGLGYSKIDAITVFAKVFLKAQTEGNMDRMRKIMDYIQRFENKEFSN